MPYLGYAISKLGHKTSEGRTDKDPHSHINVGVSGCSDHHAKAVVSTEVGPLVGHVSEGKIAIMQAGGSLAGGSSNSGPVPDATSRAMQRLKDMYARNTSAHQRSQNREPQGVKQLLQVG